MTAALNISERQPILGQITTGSTTRDTTAPSNTIQVAAGDASLPVTVPKLFFRAIEQLTERMLLWIWLSRDGGTTKRLIDERAIGPDQKAPGNNDAGATAEWSWPGGEAPLDGTNDILYVTGTLSKKVNVAGRRLLW